jgi:hypothetical protein
MLEVLAAVFSATEKTRALASSSDIASPSTAATAAASATTASTVPLRAGETVQLP